ncbi:hypothetical protein N7488_002327 [Penicillium malachiteum]|nr:hypothetical protein N7488_002327 [Penicillium malachiteum]
MESKTCPIILLLCLFGRNYGIIMKSASIAPAKESQSQGRHRLSQELERNQAVLITRKLGHRVMTSPSSFKKLVQFIRYGNHLSGTQLLQ